MNNVNKVLNAGIAADRYGYLDELLDSTKRQIELNIGDPEPLFINADRYNPVTIHEVIKRYRAAGWHLDEVYADDDAGHLVGFLFD